MANLSPTEIVKPGRPAIFVDKIWKYNGRKPIFQMVDGKSFTARGCIVGDYEYDARAPAAPATHKKNANEVKRALKPGVKPVDLIGKINGRGALTILPLTKFEKTTEFGGQGGVTSTGKMKANAATTRAQELGSTYIFKLILGTKKKKWTDVEDLKKDKTTMAALNKIWQKEIKMNVNQVWLEGYFKQHEKMLAEFGGPAWTEFDHSGSGSFMNYISGLVKNKYGISKKDNWDPADMWLISGRTTKQVKEFIEEQVNTTKVTQTIDKLNQVMRDMYGKKELVGISLKAISGKTAEFSEYNVSKFTQAMAKSYRFPNIKLTIDLKEDMSQDSKAELRRKDGGGGYNFQIKSNSSTSWSNLKWESTPNGATAARGGKAQVEKVIEMLKENGVTFEKSWKKYPRNKKEFNARKKEFETMFTYVNGKATTNCGNAAEFSKNIMKMFGSGVANEKVANSKLMQLTFLNDILSIKQEKGEEIYINWWTDLVYLSIKLGNQYGPFGKLY